MHVLLLAACCLISGHVRAGSGAPVADAHVAIAGPAAKTAVSDAQGSFTIDAPPGDYQVNVSARGYSGVAIDLKLEHDSKVEVTLQPLDAPTLRQIATVTVDGRLSPIRGAIPSVTVTRSNMELLGDQKIVQGLQTIPSATFTRPDGGGANAIAVVSLRGPDPSESIIDLDGQQLNDANTGDVDLSQFPISAFSSVAVTEGLGPEDANGSNTFGGAINLISLQPTQKRHFGFGETVGSWGTSDLWLNGTGSSSKLGYAFAVDDSHWAGYSNGLVSLYSSIDPTCSPCSTLLGSSVSARTALANVTYSFSQRANLDARVFALGDIRDQSGSINGVEGVGGNQDAKGDAIPLGAFTGPGNESLAQQIRAYQLRGQAPLGAGELAGDLSTSDDSVGINGNPSNPAYDVTHVDHRYNFELSWGRTFDNADYTIGGYTRYESLTFVDPAGATPTLGQTINVGYVRGGFQATKELRLDAGLFASRYTTFGSNLDARIAAVDDLNPTTAVRFSFGTGFRAPLLIERYLFPLDQLTQDQNGVFVGQGNPNEHPEHATEYEFGISHQFTSATLDVSLYQTNLRNPVEIYYPFGLTQPVNQCAGQTPLAPIPGCVSYNSNVGNAVYQGAEIRFVQRFVPQHVFLTAMYGLNVAYPKNLTPDFSNPTSGGNLVDNQQFAGIPQQQGAIELDYQPSDWHASLAATFRGNNNELNQSPFTWIDASIGFKLNSMTDITLAGTNVFGDAGGRYTVFGAGTPYRGNGGPILTDRYAVEPFGLKFIVTLKT